MHFHTHSYYSFCVIFLGYIAFSTTLNWLYYSRRDAKQWKIQGNIGHIGQFWGYPLFSEKPNRHQYHRIFTTINLLVSSTFAFVASELVHSGKSSLQFYNDINILWLIVEVVIAIVYQSICEYYWHRLQHTNYFYRTFHKYHHYYKAPEPYDDMMIHPIEAFGYYCILFGPVLLLPIHLYSFIIYMIIMGMCGVLDHSGIRITIPFIYSTLDHDKHHSEVNYNYAFPFVFMDVLHGTYRE